MEYADVVEIENEDSFSGCVEMFVMTLLRYNKHVQYSSLEVHQSLKDVYRSKIHKYHLTQLFCAML